MQTLIFALFFIIVGYIIGVFDFHKRLLCMNEETFFRVFARLIFLRKIRDKNEKDKNNNED